MTQDENGYEVARECSCQCRQIERMNSQKDFASVPDAYAGKRLHDFNTSAYRKEESRGLACIAFDCVRCWYADFQGMLKKGMGLYLCSREKGSGKTSLAAGLVNEILKEHPVSVKFATTIQLLHDFKNSWGKEAPVSESALIQELMQTDVLILDDFGAESAESAWTRERMYAIINSRYVDNKLTIFTSNYFLSDLHEMGYDERIIDRIREKTYRIALPEESVRKQKEEKNFAELMERMNRFSEETGQLKVPFLKGERSDG